MNNGRIVMWPAPDWLSVPVATPAAAPFPCAPQAHRTIVFVAPHCPGGKAHQQPAPSGVPIGNAEYVTLSGHDTVRRTALAPHHLTAVRHGLDLALSAGRHAAERARLADCHLLIGQTMNGMDCARRILAALTRPVMAQAPAYRQLAALDCEPLSALVGMLLASAQIGLHCAAPGTAGALAIRLALRLQPGVADWLVAHAHTSSAKQRQRQPTRRPLALAAGMARC